MNTINQGDEFLHDWSDGDNPLLEYVRVKSVRGDKCTVWLLTMMGTRGVEFETYTKRLIKIKAAK